MKKLYFAAVLCLPALFLAYQNGPQPENTGAPGEMSCYRSGCHQNNGNGKAQVFLRLDDSSLKYENQDTLRLEFGFSQAFSNEHGFQMVALDSNNQNVGQWLFAGNNQYQQISGSNFPNRKYLEHTSLGTANNSWQVEWVTPTSYQGEVRFYASFLETNNNGAPNGDTLYNQQLQLSYDNSMSLSDAMADKKPFEIQYSDHLLHFNNTDQAELTVKVFALNAALIRSFKSLPGQQHKLNLKAGFYLLRVKDNSSGKSFMEKVRL